MSRTVDEYKDSYWYYFDPENNRYFKVINGKNKAYVDSLNKYPYVGRVWREGSIWFSNFILRTKLKLERMNNKTVSVVPVGQQVKYADFAGIFCEDHLIPYNEVSSYPVPRILLTPAPFEMYTDDDRRNVIAYVQNYFESLSEKELSKPIRHSYMQDVEDRDHLVKGALFASFLFYTFPPFKSGKSFIIEHELYELCSNMHIDVVTDYWKYCYRD